MSMSLDADEDTSLLDKLDSVVPAPLAQFDAFPKLPPSYKSRSESRGLLTIFVALFAVLLVLNDVGEYIWGWPDTEFSVDTATASFMSVNIDITVNMPCRYLSVDLRDAVGDRLMLSTTGRDGTYGRSHGRGRKGAGFRRDGTLFDIGQATKLKEHSAALSARQVASQSRRSRGFFDTLFRRSPDFRPTFNHKPDASACRVFGSIDVKKVTANLHITTLGHGYMSHEHVDHSMMNLSHVINEFSFGPYFPAIAQPLDYSFEVTNEPFIAYQYYIHVVPTTYIAPRSDPIDTNQYSVTHYTRVLEHNKGTPGIFFKFDLEPMHLTVIQRTTTVLQLLIRVIGVLGGVFVCSGYAIRITRRAIDTMTSDGSPSIAPIAEASGAKANLRQKWGGGQLRARTQSGRMIRQGNGWVLEGSAAGGGASSPYAATPMSAGFGVGSPMSGVFAPSPSSNSNPNLPYVQSPGYAPSPSYPSYPSSPSYMVPGTPASAGYPVNSFGGPPPPPGPPRSPRSGPIPPPPPRSPSGGVGSQYAFPVSGNGGLGGEVNGNGHGYGNGSGNGMAPPRRVSGPKKDD